MVDSSLMNNVRTYPLPAVLSPPIFTTITQYQFDIASLMFFRSSAVHFRCSSSLLKVPCDSQKAPLGPCGGSPNQCVAHSSQPEGQSKAWFSSEGTIMAPNAILRTCPVKQHTLIDQFIEMTLNFKTVPSCFH